MEICYTKTKRGKSVICDVYWDGDFKIYTKNHQPIPHSCSNIRRKTKK